MSDTTGFATYQKCSPTHRWVWAGSGSDGKLPEGYPCECGAMLAHYCLCPTCGQEKFSPYPNVPYIVEPPR